MLMITKFENANCILEIAKLRKNKEVLLLTFKIYKGKNSELIVMHFSEFLALDNFLRKIVEVSNFQSSISNNPIITSTSYKLHPSPSHFPAHARNPSGKNRPNSASSANITTEKYMLVVIKPDQLIYRDTIFISMIRRTRNRPLIIR